MRNYLKASLFALLMSIFPAAQGQPDWDTAEASLTEFASVCKESGDRLWGASLCGRLLLVEPRSRTALATIQDTDKKFESRGAFFLGTLPPDLLIANTSAR
jgi:hypothetical protein